MSDQDPYAAPDSGAPNVVEARATASAPAASETPAAPAVPSGSVKEVTDWIGDDKERAELARKAEKNGAKRKGVFAYVEELLGE